MDASPTRTVNSVNLRSAIAYVVEEAIAYEVDIVECTNRMISVETAAVLEPRLPRYIPS